MKPTETAGKGTKIVKLSESQIGLLRMLLDGSAHDVGGSDPAYKAAYSRLAKRGLVLFTARRFVSITHEGRKAMVLNCGPERGVYHAQTIEDARAKRAGRHPQLITTLVEATSFLRSNFRA